MKNTIQIDVDTDRTPNVMIGHPPEFKPTTPEEAKSMIIRDISCVFEALCTLIHMADQSGYAVKADLIKTSIDHLNGMLIVDTKESNGYY